MLTLFMLTGFTASLDIGLSNWSFEFITISLQVFNACTLTFFNEISSVIKPMLLILFVCM